MMTEAKELRLCWARSVSGTYFAYTGDVDGWLIVIDETTIAVTAGTNVIGIRPRTQREREGAQAEAEAFARHNLLTRYGALLVKL